METSPTRDIGLQIYGNKEQIDRYTEVYGKAFVDQCIDLAITKCKPKPRPTRKPAKSTKQYRTGFKSAKTKSGFGEYT